MSKPARAARRPLQGAPVADAAPARRAVPAVGTAAPRRAASARRVGISRLTAGLGLSALALATTVGFSLAAVPQATAHDAAAPSVGARPNAAQAVTRGNADRAGALDDNTTSSPDADKLFAARQAALAQINQGTRQDATGAFLTLWSQQELARQKNGGATPKNATPTDGYASIIYPDGVPAQPSFHLPIDAGSYTLSANFGATGLWSPYHNGQDFAAPAGTPVYAVTDAIVGPGITDDWPGNHIVLHFADGGAAIYAHLTDSLVQPGQIVHAGDLIGHVGNTGRSFGAHLHFQYCPNGIYVGDFMGATNPVAWLQSHGLQP